MLKRLTLAAIALFSPLAFATPSPLPITGNLSQISGTPGAYDGVLIQLQGCPSPMSIAGYMVIVQDQYQLMANGSGVVNGSVWPNDLITCNGSTGNSQYSLTFLSNGIPVANPSCYQVVSTQGSWNLNVQQPVTCGVPAPSPGDVTYTNVVITGNLSANTAQFSGLVNFNGPVVFASTVTLPAAVNCSSGFMTGFSTTFVPACGSPATGVTSFNTRTGAVVAANGDYSYSQISGTPALEYQTVLNGPHTSDAVTQRPYLAVGSGTGLTVADVVGSGGAVSRSVLNLNAVGGTGTIATDPFAVVTAAGGTSTHCANWDATGGGLGDAGAACNTPLAGSAVANGYIEVPFTGGTIYFEWGTTSTLTANAATVITFPIAFPNGCLQVIPGDNGPRVAAGNASPVAASCTSASTFTINMESTGETGSWFAVGH